MGFEHPHKENIAMAADRFSVALVLFALSATATAGGLAAGGGADHSQPFTIRDLVRLERISEIAASPDGKRVAYTLRTTDMEANKGRTGIWLVDTGKHGITPLRLTDLAANSNAAEWSADGRFIYFLSNRSGSTQVWRVTPPGTAARSQARNLDAPGADALQVTNLPLDVGSFRVSPKGDRILVSVEVYLDCADLACTKQRMDAAAASKASGVLEQQLV